MGLFEEFMGRKLGEEEKRVVCTDSHQGGCKACVQGIKNPTP